MERYRVLELSRTLNSGGDDPVYAVSLWEKTDDENFVLVEGPFIPTRLGVPLDFIPFTFIGPHEG